MHLAMKTVRIAAAQTIEFQEDIEGALNCVTDVAARAEAEGASLLCFPEGFLQEYLTDEAPARRSALDLTSPAFEVLRNRLPKTGPMIVVGLTSSRPM
jgi:predicted amidohydrolase